MLLSAVAAVAQTPRPSGELVFHTTDGKQFLLSQHRGKVVLVAFVLTTCPHCQETSRLMAKLAQEYGPRGFQPLALAFDENAAARVPEFVASNRLTFPVGFSPREPVLDFLKYPVSQWTRLMVPQLAFIDRKGTVRVQSNVNSSDGLALESNMRANIETLLNDGGKKAPAASSAKKTTGKKGA
jgi:peroxiredoxin